MAPLTRTLGPQPSTNNTEDVLTKTSTEAAVAFVNSYYRALESAKSTVSSYYIEPISMAEGDTLPTIVWEGNDIDDGNTFQEILQKEMPDVHYDVQSVDCQVISTNYRLGLTASDPTKSTKSPASSMMIAVIVSGQVSYPETKDVPAEVFSENFILVPNIETGHPRTGRGTRRDFLIQTQNFRTVTKWCGQ